MKEVNTKAKTIKIWEAVLLTLILVVVVEIAGLVLLLPELFSEKIPYSVWSLSIMSLFANIISFICVYVFLSKMEIFFPKNNKNKFSLILCISPIIAGVSFAFLQPIFYFLTSGKPIVEYFGGGIPLWSLPKLLGLILIVPITEELFFRFFLMRRLIVEYSEKIGLLFSSILFGLAHLPNFQQVVIAFGGGLIAGYFYLKKDLIILSILFHISWNFTAHVLVRLL